MIVTRGYGSPKSSQTKGGKIVVYGYGLGSPIVIYRMVTSSTQKPRSQSSFEQLILQGSQEMSMFVGTFATNQAVQSSEPDTTKTTSRLSTDSSSTMDAMADSSHEQSQTAESSEAANEASSGEYDETQESLNKAERIDQDG